MYAMRLYMTLYACGTGHRQCRHLKILLYHEHRLWVQNSIINIAS